MRLLRRLYSTFAGGWPGTGLVLMRLVVGFALVGQACLILLDRPSIELTTGCVLLIVAGVLLTLGLFTPIIGILSALVEVWRLVKAMPADRLTYLLLATLAASLAMLGPGLWSVDARLFGWKRIEPSPRKR